MDLIGRDAELELLLGRLSERRLVTVIGPGGVGKTSVAHAAVARAENSFALGSRLVDLTRVDAPDAVGEAIATQLGFGSFDALLVSPVDQSVLLLIDNCEHVTAAVAAAVSRILAACVAPTVLATSRSPLDVPGEAVVVLGPLPVPPPGLAEAFAAASEGYILLRRDPHAAIAVIEACLVDARRLRYPPLISRNLRSLALAHLLTGEVRGAAGVVLELLDDLAGRGDLTDLRVTLEAAALVLERAGRPAWADLAATVATLPVTNINASVGHALIPIPAHEGRRLSPREAIVAARSELRELVEGVAPPTAVEPPVSAGAVFVRTGEFWEIHFAGRSAHLAASKGVADLARLLAAPGREVHCLDLVGAAVVEAGTGEVIDERARRQYEGRVRELQAEIDEADDQHDTARADRARVEYDTLVDHLAAALGVAGRTRRVGSSAERARSTITHRLRSTIRRVAEAHPPLGRHLDTSIKTGTFCSYQPEHPVDWTT